MTRLHVLIAIAIASFCLIPSLSASAVTVNAGWYGFCFGAPGSSITAGCQNDATAGTAGDPVTFTATGSVLFDITDAFEKGDTFNVNINSGAMVFTTPTVPIDSSGAVTDPNVAFADPTYSHSSVLLGPGAYSINVTDATSPFGDGGAYLQVVSTTTATPEPNSVAFLLCGSLAILFGRRWMMRRV